MREGVVVASSRTGLAKSYRGSFNMTRPDELAAHCIKDVLRKTPQLDPAEIEDVVLDFRGIELGRLAENIFDTMRREFVRTGHIEGTAVRFRKASARAGDDDTLSH